MRIRTRIIGAALAVTVAANIVYSVYYIDRARRDDRARLETMIRENNQLLGSVIAGPLYDGNIEQLRSDLDSFFLNPDIVRIVLKEHQGDIEIARIREPAAPRLGERIDNRVRIVRGIDELGEVAVTYTTANIEQRLLQSRDELILFSIASLLGLAAVIFLAARGLTRPIDRLTEAARAMAQGKLDQDIAPSGAQEIVVLGDSFVRMRDAIRQQMAALEDRNRRLSEEVAQRRQAEGERDRLISVLEATTDIVGIADPDGRILYLNQAGRRLVGMGEPDLSRLYIAEVHPPWAGKLILEQAIPAAIRDGSWSGDTALLAPDRSEIPVSQVILTHRDADGKLQFLSTIMRDIGERKRTETALRVKDDAIAASINAIAFADLSGKLTYVNRAFLRMWGHDREEEVVGRSVLDFWSEPEAAARVLEAVSTEDSWSGEMVARRRDGALFTALLSAVIIRDTAAQPVQLMGSFIDVTEQKRAEEALRRSDERLRQAVRTSEIGIFDHEHATDRLYWSPEQRAIFGWGPEEPVTPQGVVACLHPEDRDRIVEAVRRTRAPAGDGLLDAEYRIVRRNGDIRWITTRAQTHFEGQGGTRHPVRTIGAALDVTARKAAEQALRDLTTQLEARVRDRTADLEAANRELEAFSYSVSHDLRAPLRSIDGFSRVLLEDHAASLDGEGRGYLMRVRNAVQRMGALIDDLLQLSRVTRTEIRATTVDLTRIADDIVAELRSTAPARRADVSVERGLVARGDSRLLQIALGNLIRNAWKYTGKTPDARIEIGMVRRDSGPEYYVRDNGAGFDMQYAGKLFGAFQRLHSEREFPGTGIGLATVARIIHRHGGRVWGEGEPGIGATFRFTLPQSKLHA